MKLTAAGAVQDLHLFPSQIFAMKNPHQIATAKIQKIFNLYMCINFSQQEESIVLKNLNLHKN